MTHPSGLRRKTLTLFTIFVFIYCRQLLAIEESSKPVKVSKDLAKFSFGTGVTYLDFNQTFATGNNRNLRFESLDVPNFNFLLETTISESLFVKINFLKYTPSSTDSNSNTAVGQKTLGISSLGIDFNYLPFSSSSRVFLKKLGLVGGFQFSSLPLLKRTSPTMVDGEIFWYHLVKLGLANTLSLTKKLSLSSNFCYLLPVASLSGYQLTGTSFLEAELILTRLLNKRWDVGLGWQFRQQSYSVSGTEIDGVTNLPYRAQQDNLYSVLYLQVGYIW